MFVGSKEIKMTTDIEGDEKNITLQFEGELSVVINKELFDLIKTESVSNGNITDNVNDYFARKFVAELAYYDLDYYFAGNVGVAMNTLAHNLREELFRKTFNCSGGDSMRLKLLLGVDTPKQ